MNSFIRKDTFLKAEGSKSSKNKNPSEETSLEFVKKVFTQQKSFTASLLTFIPEKGKLISIGDGVLSIWDLFTYQSIFTRNFGKIIINEIFYLKHFKILLAFAYGEKFLRIWRISSNKVICSSLKFPFMIVSTIMLNNEGIWATASTDNQIIFWSLKTKRNIFHHQLTKGSEIRILSFLKKLNFLAIGLRKGEVIIYDYQHRKIIQKISIKFKISILMNDFPPFLMYDINSRLLMIGCCNNNIVVFKLNEDNKGSMFLPSKACFYPNLRRLISINTKKFILTSHDDKFIHLWNPTKMDIVSSINAKIGQSFSIAVDEKLKLIAVSDYVSNSFCISKY